MASSSTSRCSPQLKHDVFLSFRGEDTREGFVSHLHAALSQKKIETFIDDGLIRGNEISTSLLNAIEGSKISVVIFSENYASSGWCLDELVKILECKEKYGRFVIPVFYRIDPSHVRKQTAIFADAFTKHEKERVEKVQNWRKALTDAANLSGFDSNAIRPESALINTIIEDIIKKLNDISPVDNKDLVGIDSSTDSIVELLESRNIPKIGIWGIGGIGKTTLAHAIFDKISRHFEGSCFVEDVKKSLEINGELIQQKLLATIFEDERPNIKLAFTKERLSRKKVFIVFDDVTCVTQVEKLIGNLECLDSRSRIIITSRDKQVLETCGVNYVHMVSGLWDHDALQLFSRYAFRQDHPPEDYIGLSNKIVAYAKGVPLVLKVLGSFLFGRIEQDWENAIGTLKLIPHMDIQKVLQVSYDGLNPYDKNSFLDIACFFRGWKRNLVKDILEASGFYPQVGIYTLIEKSLITISSYDTIEMHDLLQDMGREIVRQESINDPRQRSRLWHHDDIYHVLRQNKGSKTIQGIWLDMSKVEEINLNPRAFKKMHSLRFFKVNSFYPYMMNKLQGVDMINKLQGFEHLESDFSELRYLYWPCYPFKSLPPNFDPRNLVGLDMAFSDIEQIWTDGRNLAKLKHIDLRNCKHLFKIPDFSKASNLENLILQGCISLHETPSVWHLNKVVTLNLKDCTSLSSSPTQIYSTSLRKVIFSGCSSLKMVPEIPCNVEVLDLEGTAIKELPPSIGCVSHLEVLNLTDCSRLERISNDICKLKSLKCLYLSGCSKLERLPDDLGNLEALEMFQASYSGIKELPSVWYLNKVVTLNLRSCTRLRSSPTRICSESLRIVSFSGCSSLKTVPEIPCNVEKLYLDETAIKELASSIGCVSHLEKLYLKDCSRLERISNDICKLKSLKSLCLSGCSKLERLPDDIGNLEALEVFEADRSGIRLLPSVWHLNKVVILDLANCTSLSSSPTQIYSRSLRKVIFSGCSSLEMVPEIPCNVKELYLNETAIKELPSSVGCVSHLEVLDLKNCLRLERISNDICKLKSLKSLYLSGCSKLERLPDDLGNLEALNLLEAGGIPIREVPSPIVRLKNLQELSLQRCKVQEYIDLLLHSLSELCHLKKLNLSDCSITELPDSLGQLSSVEYLKLSRNNFVNMPTSIVKLPRLWKLTLSNCNMLQSLPELPRCLGYVQAEGCTSLRAVPSSVNITSLSVRPNFCFFDCPKLDWDTLATKLTCQQDPPHTWKVDFYGSICFLGSEIPEWFNFRSISEIPEWFLRECRSQRWSNRNSLIMLPRGSLNHKSFVLAICIVLEFWYFPSSGDFLTANFELLAARQCGDDCDYETVGYGSFVVWKGALTTLASPAELDHMVVGCHCFNGIPDWASNSNIFIRFRIDSVLCKVKNSAVRLVYQQDCGKRKSVEDEQHSKGLKVSSAMKDEACEEDKEEEEEELEISVSKKEEKCGKYLNLKKKSWTSLTLEEEGQELDISDSEEEEECLISDSEKEDE